MISVKNAAPAEKRQMRFELEAKDHAAARVMRAETDLSIEELWLDMMRVYKKHPDEWSSAKKAQ